MANSPKMIDDTAGKSNQMSEAVLSAIKMMEDYRIETREEKRVKFPSSLRSSLTIVVWSLFLIFCLYYLFINGADTLRNNLRPMSPSSRTCKEFRERGLLEKPKPLKNISHAINEPGMSVPRGE